MWSQSTETAIVIIPEEAELLLPIVRAADSPTWILTYAAPVTRKMLHFNRLDYYAIPDLPNNWKAPAWLTVELGIFAGRLYFEWDEYPGLCQLVGLDPSSNPQEHWEDDGDGDGEKGAIVPRVDDGTMAADLDQRRNRGDNLGADKSATAAIAAKPLIFLQDWLALRRRGQDFVHTPMGHVTQSKPLHAEHPFFRKDDKEEAAAAAAQARKPSYAPITKRAAQVAESTEEEAGFDGIDEMDYATQGGDVDSDEEGDEEIEYHQDEMFPASDQEEAEGGANPSPTDSSGSADVAVPPRHAGAGSRASKGRGGGGRETTGGRRVR